MSLWTRLRALFGKPGPGPLARATELVKAHFADGFTPKVTDGIGEPDGSRFCGPALLAPGESWPTCGKCRATLQLFLQLNSRDLPAAAGRPFGEGILQLFYCTHEKCDGDYVPFASTYQARILAPTTALELHTRPGADTFPAKSITGWTADTDLPNWEELRSLGIMLTDEQEAALYQNDDANYPRQGDKLLGWPYWVQGVEYVECPHCKKRMKYLFQLDSEKNIPYMFGDSGVGHISICPDHPEVIAFTWACC